MYQCVTPRVEAAVRSAQELITAHFCETLPLQTIADCVRLSRFHLCRHFRRLAGMSIHRFQTTLRLRAALQHLDDGALDLAQLALDLGFSDHSHFATSFQREYGVTPSDFRTILKAGGVRSV
jgi:AraC family transcriptional regulator